mgnify:CR=1 FL=1
MKTMYEGMFILPKALTDEQLDGALDSIRQIWHGSAAK